MASRDSIMFEKYVRVQNKVIYPWSLSIVDCFFLFRAFSSVSLSELVDLVVFWDDENNAENFVISNAYDLYDIDTGAYGSEVVLIHQPSRCYCYWDPQEQFVVASGSKDFLALARPYPADIERHRYLEDMDSSSQDFSVLYEELTKLSG